MGKNHKHKKVLKSEKAKVKLKGRKLAKETNVTDTNFKIKKIVLNKQLEVNDEGDLLTKKKLNLKDLLSRLKHYNTNSRTDALNGIKELITNFSDEILAKNLNELLENIPRLAFDVERPIRHECFKVLSLILNPVPSVKIAPFFELITSYLCCAMTHINQNIQEDSLLFIDVLITATPNLLAKYYIKILPNFLNLISRIRLDSKIDRKLTVNLSSKQTSVRWRLKVLSRLQNLLQSIANKHENQKIQNFASTFTFNNSDENSVGIYRTNYLQTCNLACFNQSHGASIIGNQEIDNLRECIDSIMPLLFETWLENKPSSDGYQYESLITEEAAEILKTILEIIKLLISLIGLYEESYNDKTLKKDFLTKFEANYFKYFMEKFPYTRSETSVSKRETDGVDSHDQNILIVYLFLQFHPCSRKNVYQTIYDAAVFDYLQHCIPKWGRLSKETSSLLLLVLNDAFSKRFAKIKYDLNPVLHILIKYFVIKRNSMDLELKNGIFQLLCDLLENEKLSRSDDYQKFLRLLPQMLGKEKITIPILNIVATLCRRNNKEVINGIKKTLVNIVGNLEQMQLHQLQDENASTPFELLNQILYYVKLGEC